MKLSPWTKYFFTLLGFSLIFLSAYLSYSSISLIKHGHKANGIVIDYKVVKHEKIKHADIKRKRDRIYYYPIVTFINENDANIKFESSIGSTSRQYSLGQSVEVLVPFNSPNKAIINTFSSLWFNALFSFIPGLIFLSIGMFIFKRTKNQPCHS